MKRIACILLISFFALCVGAVPTAETDTLLRVLREELAADFDELQQQDVKPYFMSFRVLETWEADIVASFGFLYNSHQRHNRTFTPQVRVGSPELDNFKFSNQSSVGLSALPLGNGSAEALRAAMWLPMISAYDRASNAYRSAQSKLRSQADNEDKAPCFSSPVGEKGATYYEAPLARPALTAEEQRAWETRLCHVTAAFRQYPQFNRAEAVLQMENQRAHLVNTEGAAIVQNRVSYRVFIQASVKTEDGMVLPLLQSFYATSLGALPDEATMISAAEDVARRLVALAKAPVADPYTGPALLSGPASGVFFHEIFGHRLEGHRMKTGGQTFRKMVGEQVLPTEFQVYCDPTLTHYGAQPLNGGYVYDDEGTRARRVDNVVNGVLREFLMSRVPLDSFPQSNGHGRTAAGRDPVSRQSNLVVETRKPHTEAELRHMLLDEARRQGKENGYLFQSASGGYTMTGEGGSINSFDVKPVEVYRIYVDGRPDELVRGVSLIGTPLSMFSNIAAGGDTPSSFIGVCGAESGWVPVSATSPMIFCTKIETQRVQAKSSLMPNLAAPQMGRENAAVAGSAPEDVVFRALSDEMQRSMDSLRAEGQPAPFLIDYRLQRQRQVKITASRGELTVLDCWPWTQDFDAQVVLGDHHCSSLRNAEPNMEGPGIPMALDYDNLRRQAWLATDARYKQAISDLENKKRDLKKVTRPKDEEALDEFFAAKPVVSVQKRAPESENLRTDELAAYAQRLSLIANEFPELTDSRAEITLRQADIYRLTSEGVRVAQPQDDVVTIVFDFHLYRKANVGDVNSEHEKKYSTASEALADSAQFIRQLRQYVGNRLSTLRDSIAEDYYVGPVLLENGASRRIYNLTGSGNYIFRARHPFTESDRSIFVRRDRKIVDEKISIRQDPTLRQWEGKPLVGYYTADANGQAPQAVTLVEHGIFRGQLCGATPALGTPAPTGNLRFNNPFDWHGPMGVSTAPGVLRVESSKTVPLSKMRKMLLRSAKREGYDHAYLWRDEFMYRINVEDGSETLIGPKDIRLGSVYIIRHIGALSSEQEAVTTSEWGGARFSIVGPKAMLLNDIEITADEPVKRAKPVLTFPLKR